MISDVERSCPGTANPSFGTIHIGFTFDAADPAIFGSFGQANAIDTIAMARTGFAEFSIRNNPDRLLIGQALAVDADFVFVLAVKPRDTIAFTAILAI